MCIIQICFIPKKSKSIYFNLRHPKPEMKRDVFKMAQNYNIQNCLRMSTLTLYGIKQSPFLLFLLTHETFIFNKKHWHL